MIIMMNSKNLWKINRRVLKGLNWNWNLSTIGFGDWELELQTGKQWNWESYFEISGKQFSGKWHLGKLRTRKMRGLEFLDCFHYYRQY